MIEAYVKNGSSISDIAKSLNRHRHTIAKVVAYLKAGHSAMNYYEQYKANKRRCGRKKSQLSPEEQEFIQTHLEKDWSLDVIKGAYPDRISCSMRTFYRLVESGMFKKEDLPWKGKHKANGHTEKRGQQAFRRELRERAEIFPDFHTEFGHLEGDTIIGEKSKSEVITLAERQLKAIITLKTNGRKTSDIEQAITNIYLAHKRRCFDSLCRCVGIQP
nr:IS30 family transposase [uncultured Streptococcus sp.]